MPATILHSIETGGPGGAEQMMLRLAEAYRQRGHRQVVCLRKDGWLADQVRARGFELVLRPLGRSPDIGWMRWLAARIAELGVDAVHAHEFAMNFHASAAARLAGVPAVATFHGRAYYSETALRRGVCRLVSRMASVVAVSDDIRAHLCESAGLRAGRLHLILNGVDVARYKFDPAARQQQRAVLGLTQDQPLIGAVGSYYPVKGHRYLIEAMGLLVVERPDVQLVIAGQGPLAADLERQIAAAELQANVRLLGYVDDPAALLSAFDVFAMPSLSEGLPLALLEAAATGRAVVASRVGGIPEVINHDVTGVLVPAGEVEPLAQALKDLVAVPNHREQLGAAAARYVREKWSIDSTAEQYLNLLAVK